MLHQSDIIAVVSVNLSDEDFTYHALRHTHASKLYEAGLNEKFISERMGHKDDRVTRAVYIHLTDQSREEGRDAVNEIYNALDY